MNATMSKPLSVFAPEGSVRLMSDKSSDDFIELSLDVSGDRPSLIGHSRRTRGSRIIDTETAITQGAISDVSEDELLGYLMKEIAPLVER